jgi:hypothetical protein
MFGAVLMVAVLHLTGAGSEPLKVLRRLVKAGQLPHDGWCAPSLAKDLLHHTQATP